MIRHCLPPSSQLIKLLSPPTLHMNVCSFFHKKQLCTFQSLVTNQFLGLQNFPLAMKKPKIVNNFVQWSQLCRQSSFSEKANINLETIFNILKSHLANPSFGRKYTVTVRFKYCLIINWQIIEKIHKLGVQLVREANNILGTVNKFIFFIKKEEKRKVLERGAKCLWHMSPLGSQTMRCVCVQVRLHLPAHLSNFFVCLCFESKRWFKLF